MNPQMTYEEAYIVHNNIMAKAHKQLIEIGMTETAEKFQKMAQDAEGAFILHNLIQTALDTAYLDMETEPKTAEKC